MLADCSALVAGSDSGNFEVDQVEAASFEIEDVEDLGFDRN